MNLSEHFTLAELTASQAASRHGLDNTPSPNEIASLKRLARTLEAVRELLNAPIIISSGYRSIPVNRCVGGDRSSMHVHGLAADFIAPAYGPTIQVANAISASGIEFDQLINEYDRWVHIGLAPADAAPRMARLTKTRAGYAYGLNFV